MFSPFHLKTPVVYLKETEEKQTSLQAGDQLLSNAEKHAVNKLHGYTVHQ